MARRLWIAMLLAGGRGNRLKSLTNNIAKPAIPFGGKYRIIDFALSNCRNSQIETIGVLTQYEPHILHHYIGSGQHWQLDRSEHGLTLLTPYQSNSKLSWYEGTAGAIYQNTQFIEQNDPEHILILSGDHIYKMDYMEMLKEHIQTNADATISVVHVPWDEARRFGILNTDLQGRITEFEEKPLRPKSNKASMGIYIFKREALMEYLVKESARVFPSLDFAQHIIPSMLNDGLFLYTYLFDGYWKDVGTIESFWQANMDLLSAETNIFLYRPDWKVYTANCPQPPLFLDSNGAVIKSLVSEGCQIYGQIQNSVICSGVKIGKSSVIKDSVILPNTEIKDNVYIEKAVIGSGSVIHDGAVINSNHSMNEIELIGNHEIVTFDHASYTVPYSI